MPARGLDDDRAMTQFSGLSVAGRCAGGAGQVEQGSILKDHMESGRATAIDSMERWAPPSAAPPLLYGPQCDKRILKDHMEDRRATAINSMEGRPPQSAALPLAEGPQCDKALSKATQRGDGCAAAIDSMEQGAPSSACVSPC